MKPIFLTCFLFVIPILLSPSEARASIFIDPMYEVRGEATPLAFCPIPEKVDNICLHVDGRTKETDKLWLQNHSDYIFRYQRRMLDAACVIAEDDEATINKKVQSMWNASRERLNCRSVQFDASGGNILKFAVSSKFDQFIEDAIWWGVDLNWVDDVDKRTVLDYVQYQIEKHKGTSIESKLSHYYRLLREAGARHRHELKAQK